MSQMGTHVSVAREFSKFDGYKLSHEELHARAGLSWDHEARDWCRFLRHCKVLLLSVPDYKAWAKLAVWGIACSEVADSFWEFLVLMGGVSRSWLAGDASVGTVSAGVAIWCCCLALGISVSSLQEVGHDWPVLAIPRCLKFSLFARSAPS